MFLVCLVHSTRPLSCSNRRTKPLGDNLNWIATETVTVPGGHLKRPFNPKRSLVTRFHLSLLEFPIAICQRYRVLSSRHFFFFSFIFLPYLSSISVLLRYCHLVAGQQDSDLRHRYGISVKKSKESNCMYVPMLVMACLMPVAD